MGEQLGERRGDPYGWRDSLIDADAAVRTWAAWAMTVAADEVRARWTHSPWGPGEVAHLDRLVEQAGYTPTAWARQRLDAARAGGEAGSDSGGITHGKDRAGERR